MPKRTRNYRNQIYLVSECWHGAMPMQTLYSDRQKAYDHVVVAAEELAYECLSRREGLEGIQEWYEHLSDIWDLYVDKAWHDVLSAWADKFDVESYITVEHHYVWKRFSHDTQKLREQSAERHAEMLQDRARYRFHDDEATDA